MKFMIRHRAGTLGLALLVVGACAASAGGNVTAFVEHPATGHASDLHSSNPHVTDAQVSDVHASDVQGAALPSIKAHSIKAQPSNDQPSNVLPPSAESPRARVIRQDCGTANVQFNKLAGMQACLASQKVSFLQSDWCAVVKTYCDAQWYPFGEKNRCFRERDCPAP